MRKDRRSFLVENKKNKPRAKKKPEKKTLVIALSCTAAAVAVFLTVFLCLWFLVFNKKDDGFVARTYRSEGGYSKAECVLNLSDNVEIHEYDVVNDVFVTKEDYRDGATQAAVTLYGLAGWDGEYTPKPCFKEVVSIKGDYAVVVNRFSDGKDYIGLVKFRGEGTEEGIMTLSDFKKIPYSTSNKEQFYFCGDYVCVMGDIDSPSSEAAYTTFYKYKGYSQLLECFRIRYGYDSATGSNYTVLQYDDYVVAYNKSGAYFFDITRDLAYNGYLELSKTGAYPTPFTTTEYTVRMAVQYMGKGWFLRYATQTSTTPFKGYTVCYQSMDLTGNTVLVFARASTDFFNAKTGITRTLPQVSSILEVANRYTSAAFAETSNSYNNGSSVEDDYPCLNPADMVKDGYSVLYYYYRPYINSENVSGRLGGISEELKKTYDRQTLEDILRAFGEATYCVLDENMNVKETSTAFPVVTVDGCGFETADPYFDIKFGDAVIYTDKGKKTVLYADSEREYAVVGAQDGKATVAAVKLSVAKTESEETGMTYGAITTDGKVIVDCIYDRLSAFYDGYAIGARKEGEDTAYFRIDDKGTETAIEDMYIMKDGTYIYASDGKVGLKNNAGNVLIEAKYDKISVSDNYMVDGVYHKSFAVATDGTKCYIFRLE